MGRYKQECTCLNSGHKSVAVAACATSFCVLIVLNLSPLQFDDMGEFLPLSSWLGPARLPGKRQTEP